VTLVLHVRHAVRVLLIDEGDRLLLFRVRQQENGRALWFPPGGGLEGNEDVHSAAARAVLEETGLRELELGPEVWQRRHVFSWRDAEWDQRERWFMARVTSFEPARPEFRWWTLAELERTADDLVPRDLAAQLRELLDRGPPETPLRLGL
jgi:ADP-ribose pyrophosphatase YjhB (NUDIX family)